MYDLNKLSCCRGCGASSATHVWTSPPLPIHLWPLPKGSEAIAEPAAVFVCNQCGLAQLNDMSVLFVEKLYDEGVYVFDEDGELVERKRRVTEWAGTDFFRGKRVLELGGGNNPFVRSLTEASERWIADLNPGELARKTADQVIVGNFETMDLPARHFDVICGFLVYEHFNNPLAVSRQIAPALTDDGVVIIEVPNLFWLRRYLPHYVVFHQHQSIFTLASLDYMMAQAGLERAAILANENTVYASYRRARQAAPKVAGEDLRASIRAVAETGRILSGIAGYIATRTDLPRFERPALYGAGGSMSLFLGFAPDLQHRLAAAFDIDIRKHGRLVPGTAAVVHAPEDMATVPHDGILILSNALRDRLGDRVRVPSVTVSDVIRQIDAALS